MRTSAFVVLVLAACAGAAPVPQPNTREAARLVEKLGSADFAEREAATRRLAELGAPALDDLRAACTSEDLEIAGRAIDLVRQIDRRAAGERALAPTVVELDLKDTPLDAVLAALSKRAGCEIVLDGPKAPELAALKVTVATGKVPFWSAVLKVCDLAELQIAGAGGFVAPGATPYYGKPRKTADGAAVRLATGVERVVVLEARGGAKKRPASVHGAVLVEAFAPRGVANPGGAALVQFWPEPKLAWQSVANLNITRAVDPDGQKLTPDLTPPPSPQPPRFGKPRAVINDGTASTIGLDERFTPNVRQSVAKFKPGGAPTAVARELSGSAFALVRAAVEPLATVTLDPKRAVAVTGKAHVEMTISVRSDDKGRTFVSVRLLYPPGNVEPHGGSPTSVVGFDRTLLGLRVTDADDRAFDLSLADHKTRIVGSDRCEHSVSLQLSAPKREQTEPVKVVFWGTAVRPVEVPFALKDVPLK